MKPYSRHTCTPCHVTFNNESGICPNCDQDTAAQKAAPPETDTPDTDKFETENGLVSAKLYDFARKLERERDEALKRCKRYAEREDSIRYLSSRNKEMERAGEALADLLRSARAIAERKGEGTAWGRFDAAIAKVGIGNVTPRTFRILGDDDPEAQGTSPLDPLCVWLAAQAFNHKCDQVAGGRRRYERARSGGLSDAFTEALAKVRELFGQNATAQTPPDTGTQNL